MKKIAGLLIVIMIFASTFFSASAQTGTGGAVIARMPLGIILTICSCLAIIVITVVLIAKNKEGK